MNNQPHSDAVSKTRKKFEPWLESYLRKRCPELESDLLAAIDAFDRLENGADVTEESLSPIVEAVKSSRRPLYENASDFMQVLTSQYPLARDIVKQLANDSASHVRFNAILCVGNQAPQDFKIDIITAGLLDKSATVRTKAADWALRLRLDGITPELEVALKKERNRGARETMELTLPLLRDGYILRPAGDGQVAITVSTPRATVSTRYMNASEIESRGIEAVVAELRG